MSLLSSRRRCDQDHLRQAGRALRACNLYQPVEAMRKSYDFSKARANPYAKRLKKQVTIRLDEETINYFKSLAEGVEIPYQTLNNLYLRDCARSGKRLRLEWSDETPEEGAA
ncbi:BrnA antitoxin family protein [Sorangium sp. So ce136]